jgi:hypothetical protein
MTQLGPNYASLSFASPPSLDANCALLPLDLALALLPPQSGFIQDGGVGGRRRATAEIDVSSFPIVSSEQWKHGCEVEMGKRECVADSQSERRLRVPLRAARAYPAI